MGMLGLCIAFSANIWFGAAPAAAVAPQQTFASPEEAAASLVAAARSHDEAALAIDLRPHSEKLVF